MDQGLNSHCVTKGNYIIIIVRIFVFNFEIYSAQKCHSRISFNHKSCGGVEPVSLLNFISFLRGRTNLERQEISIKTLTCLIDVLLPLSPDSAQINIVAAPVCSF